MNKNIIVTGGLGYIGSHAVIELIGAGYTPIIIDDLSNSKRSVHARLEQMSQKSIEFYKGDICKTDFIQNLFDEYNPLSVMHFAGYKAVGESVSSPLSYYRNNIDGTLSLLEAMQKSDCKSFIFSSSATVYGEHGQPPFTEDMQTGNGITNPYGRTKFMIEEILKDLSIASPELSLTILRYFNPVGAHETGLIGEDPNGIPNNLMPYIAKVAAGELQELSIFGDDYDTKDGTGVRDYIHVVDLAKGHVAALEQKGVEPGTHIYNLGTGRGFSVKEVVKAYQDGSCQNIPYKITPRRAGDVATSYADASKAETELNWKAHKGLSDMVLDSWRFVKEDKSSRE